MTIETCPLANEECRYFYAEPPPHLRDSQEHGCRSDEDHIVPRRLGKCALSRAYIQRPENRVQICREEHDEKNAYEAIHGPIHPLPSRDEMIEALEQSEGYLSSGVEKIIRKNRR